MCAREPARSGGAARYALGLLQWRLAGQHSGCSVTQQSRLAEFDGAEPAAHTSRGPSLPTNRRRESAPRNWAGRCGAPTRSLLVLQIVCRKERCQFQTMELAAFGFLNSCLVHPMHYFLQCSLHIAILHAFISYSVCLKMTQGLLR